VVARLKGNPVEDLQDRQLILREPKSCKDHEFVFVPQKVADRLHEYALQVCNAPSDGIFPISYSCPNLSTTQRLKGCHDDDA
jgi:hypothetical protein